MFPPLFRVCSAVLCQLAGPGLSNSLSKLASFTGVPHGVVL